jgi:gas vesicle protein
MAGTIADVFGITDIEAQELFWNKQFKPKFDDFFAGVGSPRILIYYQTQYKITESGEVKDYGGHKEFFVTDGEKIKLKGKGVYFIRATKPGKPLNANASNDSEIMFGEISEHSVTSLNTIINQIYKPMVDKLNKEDWGECTAEQTKEFTQVFDSFSGELKEALKSMTSNITLEPYDPQWENEVKNIHTSKNQSQDMITDFEKIFNKWSTEIQLELDNADTDKQSEEN